MKAILELITFTAKFLNQERKLYYINKADGYLKAIQNVEDSDYYKKDMDAKGKAEREIQQNTEQLRLEIMREK